MIYSASTIAIVIFLIAVLGVLALSFFLGSRARSAAGYFAAHGQVHWFVNGIAFAGDYLSAASFLGICGLIAFFGYDGFLYSIGFLAGWVVALFVIAEPIKRLGRYTFADALDARFNSRFIKLSAAISTLVVSVFYLIPQMVGAGALITPLLGFSHFTGVLMVGTVVILIVVTAGMVSTTWVQFIKGSLLVIFCAMLTIAILARGFALPQEKHKVEASTPPAGAVAVEATGQWKDKPYERYRAASGEVLTYRQAAQGLLLCQTVTKRSGQTLVNGLPHGTGPGQADLFPVGHVASLPGEMGDHSGPLGPIDFLSTFAGSTIILWDSEKISEADGAVTTVYYQKPTKGSDLLLPGSWSTFKGVRSPRLADRLDFVSLMLALFAGTASLPHILIRYYTVKDAASARKSTVMGIASIGFFYVLTLYLGLGAMTSGSMDLTDSNMAAPLLARSFGQFPFAFISAIAFTTVLGTVSGLILAASGAVAHDIMENTLRIHLSDHAKVGAAKWAAIAVGIVAMVLGILFKGLNVGFLVGWAFNVAASANLPALVMLLFWKRTTKRGIAWAIVVGLVSSLTWLLLSAPAFKDVYGLDPAKAPAPFTQPGLVTIPLGFIVLIVVSLMTQPKPSAASASLRERAGG